LPENVCATNKFTYMHFSTSKKSSQNLIHRTNDLSYFNFTLEYFVAKTTVFIYFGEKFFIIAPFFKSMMSRNTQRNHESLQGCGT